MRNGGHVTLGYRGLMGINLGRGESARMVATSSRISVTIDGHTHAFSIRNAAAALDAVARCAGQPTLSEDSERPTIPIAGAGQWHLMESLAGVKGRPCAARTAGDQIDTILLLNDSGDLVLIGGHGDWATWGGAVPLQLSIDGAPPATMTASTVDNLILVLIKDPSLVSRLREASFLDWTIPTGHVRGEVARLGVALDAMKACKAEEVKK